MYMHMCTLTLPSLRPHRPTIESHLTPAPPRSVWQSALLSKATQAETSNTDGYRHTIMYIMSDCYKSFRSLA